MGNIKDYATSTVAIAPSPATGGTSLTVASGHGSRFPATPFSVTAHPDNEIPTLDNAERLLVTGVSGDTFTVVRAQGNTTAKNIADGWRITNALFEEDLDSKADRATLDYIDVSVTTAASTVDKVGTTTGGGYVPSTGDILLVTFSLANTGSNPTLNVDGSGAKSILIGNVAPSNIAMAGTKVLMWYDGTAYQLFGSQRASDTNTTYTGITGSTATTTAATKTLAINSLDLANYASGQLAYTLPATAAVGSVIEVYGMSSGGWRITAPAGDNIIMEDGVDSGAAGHIFASQYSWVQLRCTVANTTWVVTDSNGILENNNGNKTGVYGNVVDTAAQTLSSKRIDPRVSSTTSASSLTPTIASYDQYIYTALAANLTINAPTGTPVNGNKLLFAIKDNGTSRTLTWNAAFAAAGIAMPTLTTVSKWHYIGFIYNATADKWHCIAATKES